MAHLHGYQVEHMSSTLKRHGFLLKPPEPQMRTFSFCAENETDQRRYIDFSLLLNILSVNCLLFMMIELTLTMVGLITMPNCWETGISWYALFENRIIELYLLILIYLS